MVDDGFNEISMVFRSIRIATTRIIISEMICLDNRNEIWGCVINMFVDRSLKEDDWLERNSPRVSKLFDIITV